MDDWRERLAAIVDAIPEGIALVRPDGTLDALNAPARTMFLRADRAAPSGADSLVGALSIADLVAAAMAGERPPRRDVALGAGEVFEVGAFPVGSPATGVAVVLRDVSRERAQEAWLRETERSRALGESLARVAHELNNPLTSVAGFAELIAAEAPPDLADHALHVQEQAQRCLGIVQDVLAVAGKRRREDRRLDVAGVVAVVRTVLRDALDDAAVALAVEGRARPAHADPRLVQQVLANLVRNGVEAFEPDGPGPRRVVVRLRERPGRVVVEVEDAGPGLDEASRRRVEQALADPQATGGRSGAFHSTKPGGTGLGLRIAADIVREYGGALTVESGPGRTVFRFDLPAWEGAQPGSTPAPAVEAGTDRLARPAAVVVVADDDPAIRRLLAASLSKLGHTVRCHATGAAAWDDLAATAEQVDVALVDLRMPAPDGLELHRRLRERGAGLADRLVLITGEVDDELLRRARDAGVRVLKKPFRLAEARALVEELRGVARRRSSTNRLKTALRPRDLAGARVLVADEVRVARALVVAALRPRGATVVEAAEVEDAVARVTAAREAGAPFDVVLLDLERPGLDVARRLRDRSDPTPVLVLAPAERPADRERILDAGATGLLAKGAPPAALVEAVRAQLPQAAPAPALPPLASTGLDLADWLEPGAVEAPSEASAVTARGLEPAAPADASDDGRLRSTREGDPDFAPLLDAYKDDLRALARDLAAARAAGDAAAAKTLCHRVAGTGGSYGYPSLTDAGRAAEAALQAGLERAGPALDALLIIIRAAAP